MLSSGRSGIVFDTDLKQRVATVALAIEITREPVAQRVGERIPLKLRDNVTLGFEVQRVQSLAAPVFES